MVTASGLPRTCASARAGVGAAASATPSTIAPEVSVGALQRMGNAISVNPVNLTSPTVATRSIAAPHRAVRTPIALSRRSWIRSGRLFDQPADVLGHRPRRAAARLDKSRDTGSLHVNRPGGVCMMTPPGPVARMERREIRGGGPVERRRQY